MRRLISSDAGGVILSKTLFQRARTALKVAWSSNQLSGWLSAPSASKGLTLEEYAYAKQLPVDWLLQIGLRNCSYAQIPAVRIPFFNEQDGAISHIDARQGQ